MDVKTGYAIGLGDGVRITPARYLTVLRRAMANPDLHWDVSFRDPRGWRGVRYSGATLVREHWEMIAEKYERQWKAQRVWGHGNKANRRKRELLIGQRECHWCGHKPAPVRGGNKWFCCVSCAKDYAS